MLTDPAFAVQYQHAKHPKRETDGKHLDFVRSLPCCLCRHPLIGKAKSHAHHLLRGVTRGMGMKASDRKVIPLCDLHHFALHADGNETRYLREHGVNGPFLADALYAATGNFDRAVRLLR